MKTGSKKRSVVAKSKTSRAVVAPEGILTFLSRGRIKKRLREICPLPQGRRRKPIPQHEVHLVFFGEFNRWLKKTGTRGIRGAEPPSVLWGRVTNQQAFFVSLVAAALHPSTSPFCHLALVACFKESPDLTCMALPMLRQAVKEFKLEERGAIDRLIPWARKGIAGKMAEADLRRRIRKNREQFMGLSGGLPILEK